MQGFGLRFGLRVAGFRVQGSRGLQGAAIHDLDGVRAASLAQLPRRVRGVLDGREHDLGGVCGGQS